MAKIPENLLVSGYSIKDNTLIKVAKDDWRDRIKVEVGDSKVANDFKPQIKVQRWDNECNYSVRLIDNELDIPQIITEDNKIKFVKNKLEAHFYDVPKSDEHNEGGYEFEVLLKKKPLTNKVRFTLQDKDVEYFYQPALTEEKLKEGQTADETHIYDKDGKIIGNRPENAVDSYAVYAKTPKTNWKGGKLYKTGKVGHIYRPKIIDNAGKEVWGKLNISNGILTITIDQNWLDNAVYPVKVDPTFGYDTKGGTAKYISYYSYIGRYAPSSSGNAESISWYLNTTGTRNIKVAIYDNSLNLLKDGGPISYSGTGFKTINLDSNQAISSGVNYYLAGRSDGSSMEVECYYDTVSDHYAKSNSNSYATFPSDPFEVGDSYISRKFSVYCTYTAGGGGGGRFCYR